MSTRFLLVGGGLLVCLLLVFAVFFIPAYLGNLAGPENTGSAGQSPSPVELAGQPRVDPAPVVSPPEDFQPFDHHLVLGVIVDPTRFVDQRQPENQDVVVVDLHLKLQEELAGALGQAGFPVVPVKNEEWNGIQKSIVQEQGGFDYGLAVGSLLKEKQANLFLSLSGFRNDEKQTYQFELHFFNLAGAAFFVQKMEIPIGSVDEESESGARLMFEDWLSDMFEPERDVSTGASLEGGGEIPPIKGIVVLPAFEEGESPPSAFEFIDGQQRAQLQKQIAEKLRRQLFDLKPVSKTKITTPSLEEWRAARDVDSVETWEELLGPFDANAVLSIHGEYDETLMTYGVELELNQMGTIFLQGQHRFAYTEEEFRENFGEVALELLKAPILQGGKRPEEATGRD